MSVNRYEEYAMKHGLDVGKHKKMLDRIVESVDYLWSTQFLDDKEYDEFKSRLYKTYVNYGKRMQPNKISTVPCKYCGKPIEIRAIDYKGDFADSKHGECLFSNIGYILHHPYGDCPIGGNYGEQLGSSTYDTVEDAIADLNGSET